LKSDNRGGTSKYLYRPGGIGSTSGSQGFAASSGLASGISSRFGSNTSNLATISSYKQGTKENFKFIGDSEKYGAASSSSGTSTGTGTGGMGARTKYSSSMMSQESAGSGLRDEI
jgi:hypothetical protein